MEPLDALLIEIPTIGMSPSLLRGAHNPFDGIHVNMSTTLKIPAGGMSYQSSGEIKITPRKETA